MFAAILLSFALILPINMPKEAPMPDKFQKMRQDALAQVGKPYIFGYEVNLDDPDPRAFDCSELAQWLFHRQGRDISDGTWNQESIFSIDIQQPSVVGDMFFMPGHDGIYIGEGQVVEARGRRYGVVKTTVADINRRGGDWRRLPDWVPVPKPPPKPEEEEVARELKVFNSDRGFQIIGADNENEDSTVAIHFRKGKGQVAEVKVWIYPDDEDPISIFSQKINDTKYHVVDIDYNKIKGPFGLQVTRTDDTAPFWITALQK